MNSTPRPIKQGNENGNVQKIKRRRPIFSDYFGIKHPFIFITIRHHLLPRRRHRQTHPHRFRWKIWAPQMIPQKKNRNATG